MFLEVLAEQVVESTRLKIVTIGLVGLQPHFSLVPHVVLHDLSQQWVETFAQVEFEFGVQYSGTGLDLVNGQEAVMIQIVLDHVLLELLVGSVREIGEGHCQNQSNENKVFHLKDYTLKARVAYNGLRDVTKDAFARPFYIMPKT